MPRTRAACKAAARQRPRGAASAPRLLLVLLACAAAPLHVRSDEIHVGNGAFSGGDSAFNLQTSAARARNEASAAAAPARPVSKMSAPIDACAPLRAPPPAARRHHPAGRGDHLHHGLPGARSASAAACARACVCDAACPFS
jgi:hypothetical protein